jgi:hypothetical protein
MSGAPRSLRRVWPPPRRWRTNTLRRSQVQLESARRPRLDCAPAGQVRLVSNDAGRASAHREDFRSESRGTSRSISVSGPQQTRPRSVARILLASNGTILQTPDGQDPGGRLGRSRCAWVAKASVPHDQPRHEPPRRRGCAQHAGRPTVFSSPPIAAHTSTSRHPPSRARCSPITPTSSSGPSSRAAASSQSQSLGGARSTASGGSGSTSVTQPGMGSPVTSYAMASRWPDSVAPNGKAR